MCVCVCVFARLTPGQVCSFLNDFMRGGATELMAVLFDECGHRSDNLSRELCKYDHIVFRLRCAVLCCAVLCYVRRDATLCCLVLRCSICAFVLCRVPSRVVLS